MKSIDDKTECASAATQFQKSTSDVQVKEVAVALNDEKPTGCSWHEFGNLELWVSSSGNCNVDGYSGCFCKKIEGKY